MLARKMEVVAYSGGAVIAVRCSNCPWYAEAGDLPPERAQAQVMQLFEEHRCEGVQSMAAKSS
jgi:hypothetical protein